MARDTDRLNVLEEQQDEEHDAKEAQETAQIADALDIPEQEAQDNLIEMPDGSVIVSVPNTKAPFEDKEHYANLAESLEDGVLDLIAYDFLDLIKSDQQSRQPRDKQYDEGLRRTGLGEPAPGGGTFEGANKITHPLLSEAIVDFASSAIKQLLPPTDLVRTYIKSKKQDKHVLDRAERKSRFMNWQLNEQIPEFRDESEQMLTQLPLGGSQYIKIFFDGDLKRPRVEWVPIDRVLLPFAAASFYSASRVTEVEDITADELRVRIDQGLYRDVDEIELTDDINQEASSSSADMEATATQITNDKIEGKAAGEEDVDGTRRLYHVYGYLRIKEDSHTKGERAPYLFTIDEEAKTILALYRNWESGDESRTKINHLIEFKFIPWRGPLGIGLPHLIGGLSGAATGALRALLDAAHTSNSQTIAMMKSGITGESARIEPGQVFEIDQSLADGNIRNAMMPLPFPPPSPVLMELLQYIEQAGRGMVSTADEKMQELPANVSATHVLNLVESGAVVFSSIHARLHRSFTMLLKELSRLNYWHLDQMQNMSGTAIEVRDFASNTDVLPISDPHIFSETQRLNQAQAVMQLAATAKDPKLYDERKLHRTVLQAMNVPYIDEIMPDPEGIVESNPVLENLKMATGTPSSAYPDQDHIAHMITHCAFVKDPNYGANPLITNKLAPVMLEHLKQHMEMHYLQSIRLQVKQDDTGGEDIFDLHEEKALSVMDQQSIMMTALKVHEANGDVFAEFAPTIEQLQKAASSAAKSAQERAMMSDPSAGALIMTEKQKLEFETKRVEAEMAIKKQELEQDFAAKVQDLQTKVDELIAKYQTDKQLDENKNATAISIASLNNESRERVEGIKLGQQADAMQAQLEQERNMLGAQAALESRKAIEQHGMDVQKQNIDIEAQRTAQQLDHTQEQAMGAQQAMAQPQQSTPAPDTSQFPLQGIQAPQGPVPMAAGGLAGQVLANHLAGLDPAKQQVVDKLQGENNGV